jgi:hypothetical protein
MRYPGYLLNPGDMFQVDPQRVMWATGAPKVPETTEKAEGEGEKSNETAEEESTEPVQEVVAKTNEADVDRDPREVLKDLQAQAKGILRKSKQDIGAKRKQDLRAFASSVKRLLSRATSSTILTDSLEAQFLEIQNQLRIRKENKEAGTTSLPAGSEEAALDSSANSAAGAPQSAPPAEDEIVLSDADLSELYGALAAMKENPVDDSKPYATPWMPRDYMSAFAFIPRFLEVNHNICAAVYLRHPVARPGLAEVPSPFNHSVQGTAFAWYLRRR